MDLLANPVIETLLGTVLSPMVLAVTVLVAVVLGSGVVARSVEIVEERVPLRVAAGTRSPGRAPSGPGA